MTPLRLTAVVRALLALAGVLALATPARGACGDHVTLGAGAASHSENRPADAPQLPLPCTGPNCSAHNPVPLAPPTPPPTAGTDCLWHRGHCLPTAAGTALTVDSHRGRAIHRTDPPWHPPLAC